ncbi:hypothetical protein [uncultured Flavobacterium sp.]|uniref:hypothetical protein n=1 Tax=uncultured Flavobacterium sp. TaxID=165435 RepID=UPI0025E9ABDF|nr:hypothetical protein [uncultured Flavobacterium sp.]
MENMSPSEIAILNNSLSQLNYLMSEVSGNASGTPPAGTPTPAELTNILSNALNAPGTTSIVQTDTNPPAVQIQGMLNPIQSLDSYIMLLAALCVYNEHPSPYDISMPSDATAFVSALAKWRYYAITNTSSDNILYSNMPWESITQHSFSKNMTSADLHSDFLAELFGTFALPEYVMGQLDGILTSVFAQLKSLSLSFESQNQTLDHFLTYYYFDKQQDPNMQTYYSPQIRTFYLQIDQQTWEASNQKSSASDFNFNMVYCQMDSGLNIFPVAEYDELSTCIQLICGQSPEEISAMVDLQLVMPQQQYI